MLKRMSNEKDNYTCPICHEFTCHDEWADDNSCINCGPVDTDEVEKPYFLIDNHIK